jgi:hypothetical protein
MKYFLATLSGGRFVACIGACFLLTAGAVVAGEIRLADRGEARCVIVAPSGSRIWDGDNAPLQGGFREVEPERLRRLHRDSIRDLAHYLGRMAATEIEIVESPADLGGRVPIYIGSAAEAVFGPVGISMAGKFGFRLVADKRGIGLYGESAYGTSYAVYELLHRLGCRWYMPSEMGECIPETRNLTVPEMDEKLAPATEWRRIEGRTADADFMRRNRLGTTDWGGNIVDARHALEGWLTAEQREQNPGWRRQIDGQPRGNQFRWTREDVASAVADNIIARLDTSYTPAVSLAPGDYVAPTEDPEELKHDPEPRVWEPAAGRWSVTDRLMMLCSRVAAQVGRKYPDVLFGVLAYANYSMPPGRETVHPNVIPMIAPIDFNRHHPMTWPDHPNGTWLLDMVKGWGAKAPRLAYYAYGMNLAELSAPNPFITKWGTDIPILMENNVVYWAPETMGGWESMMPGFYLAIRMTFYPQEKPDDILRDLWTRFYGAAAEPMARYWHRIDHAWIDAKEYSGCAYGYLRMFTPSVMQGARADVDEAKSKCQTVIEYRRVRMIDESLAQFELFMKMREDFAAARLTHLERDLNQWRASQGHLFRQYRPQFAFGFPYAGVTLTEEYVKWFFLAPYVDASRMERELARHGKPMTEWKWQYNPDAEEAALPWTAPDYDDAAWPTMHIVRETWSTIGHHNTMTDAASGRSGRMVYRAAQRLGAVPAGKRAFLWIGSTDGSAKLFVNGRHVSYVVPEETRQHKAGEVIDRFSGYCKPAQFDVTDALKTGDNQFAILCERTNLNELGTGGLMGPVVLFRER